MEDMREPPSFVGGEKKELHYEDQKSVPSDSEYMKRHLLMDA